MTFEAMLEEERDEACKEEREKIAAEMAAKDSCIAAKDECIAAKDAEIRRLNELLASKR